MIGMSGKHEELLHYLEEHNVLVAAIQETKYTSKSKVKATPNYTLVRKDRGKDKDGQGGGLAFLIHSIPPLPPESLPPRPT